MAWWIVGILAVLLVLHFKLYWTALKETRQVVYLLVMVLLDDKVRDAQRGAILDYASRSDAKNAYGLMSAVNQVMPNHAMKMQNSVAGAA